MASLLNQRAEGAGGGVPAARLCATAAWLTSLHAHACARTHAHARTHARTHTHTHTSTHPPLQEYITAIQLGEGETKKKYSSRYIGSMVGDVHRTLLYGGIFGA